MIIWALNLALLALAVFLVVERLGKSAQLVIQYSTGPGMLQVGIQVRTGASIIHNAGAA